MNIILIEFLFIEFLYAMIVIAGIVIVMLALNWLIEEISYFLHFMKLSKDEKLKWKAIEKEVKDLKKNCKK